MTLSHLGGAISFCVMTGSSLAWPGRPHLCCSQHRKTAVAAPSAAMTRRVHRQRRFYNTNPLFPQSVGYEPYPVLDHATPGVPFLRVVMPVIHTSDCKRIPECGAGHLERDVMVGLIGDGFDVVPVEFVIPYFVNCP